MYQRKRHLLDDEYGPQTQMQAHQQSFYENLPGWTSEKEPYVLEAVSRKSPQRRREWLAHGNVAQKRRQLKQRRDEMVMGPMRQRQQAMQMNRPLGDREKLLMQFGQQEKMAGAGQAESRRAALLAHSQRRQLAGEGREFTGEQAEIGRDFSTGQADIAFGRRKEFADYEQSIQPPTIPRMRAEYVGGLEQGTPEFERGLGIPQQDPYANIPSMAEQESMILGQLEPGSPEWWQMRQQIEDIKRAPIDPTEQLLMLQRLARGARELGWGGAMGKEMPEQAGVGAFAQARINQLMDKMQGPQQEYQIGDIVTNPQGQQGKVVGFNPDGTPLIEPL